MPKYYKKKYTRGARDKYSVEQTAARITVTAGANTNYVVVPSVATQGMRKVKHLKISMANSGTGDGESLYWALVYVPQGTSPSALVVGAGAGASLYEPNQFVMSCGVLDFSAGPQRIHSPLSRNLNSGDAIYLCLANPNTTSAILCDTVIQYAITLQ